MTKEVHMQNMLNRLINNDSNYSFRDFCYELEEKECMNCFREYYDEKRAELDNTARQVIIRKMIRWLDDPSNYIYKNDIERFKREKEYWLHSDNYAYLWGAGKNSTYPVPYSDFWVMSIILCGTVRDIIKILDYIYSPWMLMEFFAVIDDVDKTLTLSLLFEAEHAKNHLILPSILDYCISAIIQSDSLNDEIDKITAYLVKNTETCKISWEYMRHLLYMSSKNDNLLLVQKKFASGIHDGCVAKINIIKDAKSDDDIESADALWMAIFISNENEKNMLLKSVNLLLTSNKEINATVEGIPQTIHYDFAEVYMNQPSRKIVDQWLKSWELIKDNNYAAFMDPFGKDSIHYRIHKQFLLMIGLALCDLLHSRNMEYEFGTLYNKIDCLLRFELQTGARMNYEMYSFALYLLTIAFGISDFSTVIKLKSYPYAMLLTIVNIFKRWDKYSEKMKSHEDELKGLLKNNIMCLDFINDNNIAYQIKDIVG